MREQDKLLPKAMLDYLESLKKDNDEWQRAIELSTKYKGITINGKEIDAKDLLPKKK